jgi:glycine amidinotransferase
MSVVKPPTVINSWNEWDPLRQVIVGVIASDMVGAPDPGVVLEYPEVGIKAGEWRPIPAEVMGQAIAEMEKFVSILESRSIRVDRPTPHPKLGQKVSTPDWEHDFSFGCMPPRDLLLCHGNVILEATMSARSRWYEYLCYRPLMESYFSEDRNFIWEAAPKPRLSDQSYVDGYWHNFHHVWSEEEKLDRARKFQWQLTDREPLFDAADVFRFGRDLFVQRSVVTNQPGIDWLRRHFEPRGIRVHEIAIGGLAQPWHLDTTIIAPRAGLLIQNPRWMPLAPEFHELLRINDWEIVMAAPPSDRKPHPFSFASDNIGYNVFSINPKMVCVETSEKRLMDQLDLLGFDVVPVDFYHVTPFGGALHCATLDVHREGSCEDYFPRQIEGF